MAGGVPAGRLSIEIVAEIARLQADLDKAKRMANAASGDIAKSAKAANDNLAAIGTGAGKGVQQYARDVAALKAQLDPAWASTQKYRQEVETAQKALAQGAITHQQYVQAVRQSATAAGLLKDKQAEVAAAAEKEAQAQRDAAMATEQAARAAQDAARQQAAYATQAAALRAQLDPMFAAQQRFNQAMDVADDLLRAGAITSREYAAAQKFARETLQQHAKAVAGSADELKRLSPEIVKTSGNARGFALQMSQVGQQVMAGTSVIQALAIQLPDIAAGMNASKAGASGFAAFLAGPWGIAATAAIGLAASFAVKLFDTDDAAKKAEKSQRSFVDVLRDSKSTWEEVSKAARAYNDEQKKVQQTTLDGIAIEARGLAERSINAVKDMRILMKKLEAANVAEALVAAQGGGAEASANSANRILDVEKRIKSLASTIKELETSAQNSAVAAATAIAELNVDPAAKIRAGYDQLEKSAKAHFSSTRELAARLTELGKGEAAALERLSESNRKHADETLKLARVTGSEIAKALGAPITSSVRSAAKNKAVGGAVNSHHLTGTAIDIPISVGGKPFTKAGIRATLAPLGVQIKELLGPGDKGHKDHFHIAFGVKRLTTDQVRDVEEDAANVAKKSAEKAAKVLQDEKDFWQLLDINNAIDFNKDFAASQTKEWQEFGETLENIRADKLDQVAIAAEKARQEAEALNDQFRDMIGVMGSLGKVGQGLGALLGIATGNTSGLGGPLGDLLNLGMSGKDESGEKIASTIGQELTKLFKATGAVGKAITGTLKNAGMGIAAGSLMGKQSTSQQAGSAVGGALGGKISEKVLTKGLESITKGLGDFAGPLGAIAGGVLGNVLGGLFKKAKWGRVDLTSAGVSGASGNSGSSEKAALASGNSILTGLEDLATQLGGAIGDFGSISVGVRNDDYRVNTGGTSLKIKKGAVNFGEDAEAAVAFAMKEAIERGAITGIRSSTNNLLKAGDDLQAQLQKAINFEGVFSELKGVTDPVGAALDDVNKQFDQLRVVFKEAGASAEEYAQLEHLLTIKRNEAMDKERDALDDIRSRIADAQGDDATVKSIARAKELKDALNDNVRAELKHLYAVEDAVAAQQVLTDAQTAAAASADQLKDAWASIGADLMDEVNRIRGLTGAGGASSFAALQGQFNAAAGSARGGDQAAAAKLVELSQSLIEAAGNAASSRQELDRVKAETAATLEGVARLAGAPMPQANSAPNGGSKSDPAVAETRDEIAALRSDMMAALADIAGSSRISARVLRDVSDRADGQALAVASAA